MKKAIAIIILAVAVLAGAGSAGAAPEPDDCLTDSGVLPIGAFVILDDYVGAPGTTRWSLFPCGPTPVVTEAPTTTEPIDPVYEVVAEAPAVTQLPSTGTDATIAFIAALILAAGLGALYVARRDS